jgi:hypothetical protein
MAKRKKKISTLTLDVVPTVGIHSLVGVIDKIVLVMGGMSARIDVLDFAITQCQSRLARLERAEIKRARREKKRG